jgi:hypothetical protein
LFAMVKNNHERHPREKHPHTAAACLVPISCDSGQTCVFASMRMSEEDTDAGTEETMQPVGIKLAAVTFSLAVWAIIIAAASHLWAMKVPIVLLTLYK